MFALGISYSAFVSLLIPPFVSDVGGDASTAGIVVAIIALGDLGGPPIGAFADRSRKANSLTRSPSPPLPEVGQHDQSNVGP
jgi:predicted MFS family arabinose efflux permease